MTISKRWSIPFCLLICLWIPQLALAQDDADAEAIKKVFEEMGELEENGDWKGLLEHMTEDAAKQAQVTTVTMAVELGSEQLDQFANMMPGLEDARDAVAEVLENHGLGDLELPSSIQITMGPPGAEDEEDLEEPMEMGAAEDIGKKVMDALDKVENRWQLLKEINEALEESPFAMGGGSGTFGGELVDVEVDGDSAKVEIEMDFDGGGMGGGMQFEMPPMIAKFQKVDGQWKYAGLDMEAFEMEMGGGGAPQRF